MYGYTWTKKDGIFQLGIDAPIQKEIRPVFAEELDFFEMSSPTFQIIGKLEKFSDGNCGLSASFGNIAA